MPTVAELLADLDAEYAEVRDLVSPLGDAAPGWDLPTPAEGWAVRDQISHLAFFDDAGRLAKTDPEAFAAMAAEAFGRGGDPMAEHLERGRSMGGSALLDWWQRAHDGLRKAFAGTDPSARIPWFGPPMGVLSFLSARLMETWAHGQDVADALGRTLAPTDRLRHVADLGVRARPFSYAVRDRTVPAGWIEVELTGPSGDLWRWEVGAEGDGSEPEAGREGDAADSITGSALDFCLVVTQRRNVADTGLVVRGGGAKEWMAIAQAFAGPPGRGRPAH